MRLIGMFSLCALFVAGPALAGPPAQVAGGRTSVVLSDTFTGALGELGVDAGAIAPAKLRKGKAAFPIPAGALDLATARGDIFHSGGLKLSAGTTTVRLLNFVIDTQDEPVITGLVFVNGDLVARIPLFDLVLNSAPEVSRSRKLLISDVDVLLSAAAAAALNSVFGIDDFTAGLLIGEGSVETKIASERRSEIDDNEDDD